MLMLSTSTKQEMLIAHLFTPQVPGTDGMWWAKTLDGVMRKCCILSNLQNQDQHLHMQKASDMKSSVVMSPRQLQVEDLLGGFCLTGRRRSMSLLHCISLRADWWLPQWCERMQPFCITWCCATT